MQAMKTHKECAEIKMKVMGDTIQRMHDVIGDLSKRLENVEINVTKKQLTVTGLVVSTDKSVMIREIEAFLDYELGITVTVEDAYTLGNGMPPQIIFALQTLQDKHLILQNRSLLKGVKNQLEQAYYINDYQPSVTNEKKRKEGEVLKRNNSLQEKDRKEIEFKKGIKYVDGIIRPKQIREPEPDDILNLSTQDYDKLLNLPVSKPAVITEADSKFIAYTVAADSIETIQTIYIKMRLLHPKARHIVCAYRVQVDEDYEEIEGCDDQEPGAARSIIKMMWDNDIQARAFYVIRYCGHAKLSGKRFECYAHAAKLVLHQHPKNIFLGIEQKINMDTISKPKLSNQQKQLYASIVAKRGGPRKANRQGYTSRGGRGGSRHYTGQKRQENKYAYLHHTPGSRKRERSPEDVGNRARKTNNGGQEQHSQDTPTEEWSQTNSGEWGEA